MAVSAGARKSDDPVVMTVGGQKVALSEFEYLYRKNNVQQQVVTSLDDYVDMFINYKLKVIAAKNAGIDTMASYVNDMVTFRTELAQPYMIDRGVTDSLVEVAYGHLKENVAVSHIMVPVNGQYPYDLQVHVLDSIRGLIKGGADFGDLARKYSIDPAVQVNGGYMGYITGGMLPYAFEDAAYNTPVGEISEPVATMFGLHIIRVEDRRADRGEVKTRHILKVTQGLDDATMIAKKVAIDSIYQVLKGGADFATVAMAETEDPTGRTTGGDLPWVGSGRVVPEFEDVMFSLADGEISEPVLTRFGYHIVLREGHRGVASIEAMREAIEKQIMNDERLELLRERSLQRYAASTGAVILPKGIATLNKEVKASGGYNADARKALAGNRTHVMKVGGKKYSFAQIADMMPEEDYPDVESMESVFREKVFKKAVADDMMATLPDREPEYRNLINEYSDGLLLYEISNRMVWERPNTDPEGLEEYFRAHSGEFVWSEPHYRGYVLSATSDSIADKALDFLQTNTVADDALTSELRKRFGTAVKIERVIASASDNAVVAYVAFGADKPSVDGRWASFRAYGGQVLQQPEKATDIRGQVSMRYQQSLENEWVKSLRDTYQVTVDYAVLNRLR